MFPPEVVSRRICPRHQVVVLPQSTKELHLELEPLPINYRGFAPRLPAVTREELEEASRLFVLAEQQRREGRAS